MVYDSASGKSPKDWLKEVSFKVGFDFDWDAYEASYTRDTGFGQDMKMVLSQFLAKINSEEEKEAAKKVFHDFHAEVILSRTKISL